MISTRLHGAIDLAVGSLLGTLAAGSRLSRPVRRVLGTASAIHLGYAPLTDYEAGVKPVLSMRQHLALDTAGGLALCLAALTMRREPAASRLVLLAAGLGELAVIAASSTAPQSGPGQDGGTAARLFGGTGLSPADAGYPPLDTPKEVADGVFVVDSVMTMPPGVLLPLRMTVVRLPDGSVLLHSPTRFDFALRDRIEAIGPIRHLVAPNVGHWMFVRDWQRHVPGVVTWAAPGLRERKPVQRSGVRLDHDLGGAAPEAWGGAIETVVVPGGAGFSEVAMFHAPSRTLVLTDLVLNLEPRKLPLALRPVVRLFGSVPPDGMPPPYLRFVVRMRRDAARAAAERVLALGAERVVFAHGPWFERDGTASLRRSLRWLLG